MASIIKVDQIQTAAGGTPTAGGLGLNTTGSVLQVVTSFLDSANRLNTSSTSYQDTGHSATITPTSSSSTILVLLDASIGLPSDANQAVRVKIFRDSTEILYSGNIGYSVSAKDFTFTFSTSIEDSPSTTSAITYKTQAAVRENTSTGSYGQESCGATITLMEIAG